MIGLERGIHAVVASQRDPENRRECVAGRTDSSRLPTGVREQPSLNPGRRDEPCDKQHGPRQVDQKAGSTAARVRSVKSCQLLRRRLPHALRSTSGRATRRSTTPPLELKDSGRKKTMNAPRKERPQLDFMGPYNVPSSAFANEGLEAGRNLTRSKSLGSVSSLRCANISSQLFQSTATFTVRSKAKAISSFTTTSSLIVLRRSNLSLRKDSRKFFRLPSLICNVSSQRIRSGVSCLLGMVLRRKKTGDRRLDTSSKDCTRRFETNHTVGSAVFSVLDHARR